VPAEIECLFTVEERRATVHAELLSRRDFIAFLHGRDYDTLATTPAVAGGAFRRMISSPGEYRVVISNARNAPPVTVGMTVSMNANPEPAQVSGVVPLRRRLVVIATSCTFFFAVAFWFGRPLLRAWRTRPFRY